ncbi:RNA-directed DNA polymerase from mobile element jockey-like [Gigaspora margarita]|uniref:RNA-directed DNA polymerase from mobile element jockey-like n=1 Tax=Gigaspora margarita TaxID=4874 RepID=A0A8H3X1N4_GIGMA|nr:RNA-directed DNA polymerase from mobile element jockey-like [Gigaspora margarita]
MVEEINDLVKRIHTFSDLEYRALEAQDIHTDKFTATSMELKQVQQSLYKARTLENQKDKRNIINEYINKRYENFSDNTTRMIDSVLGRHMDIVNYDNIRTPSGIVTKAEDIQEATRHYFCRWTKLNPLNQEKWKEWKQEYEPLKDINAESVISLTKLITIAKVSTTIANSPLNKTTGPSMISNKMLKRLLLEGYKILVKGMNACLKLETTPGSGNEV